MTDIETKSERSKPVEPTAVVLPKPTPSRPLRGRRSELFRF